MVEKERYNKRIASFMELIDLQKRKLDFDIERGWDKSRASNVFVHLIEELEIMEKRFNIRQ